MKNALFFLALFLLFCSCENLYYREVEEVWGCHTQEKEDGTRYLLHCCSQEQYEWEADHMISINPQWREVQDCSNCH